MRTFITCALSILVAANAALIAQSPATQNATGRVTAVAADSITIHTSTVRVKYAASADKGPRATEIRIVVKAVRKQ